MEADLLPAWQRDEPGQAAEQSERFEHDVRLTARPG